MKLRATVALDVDRAFAARFRKIPKADAVAVVLDEFDGMLGRRNVLRLCW